MRLTYKHFTRNREESGTGTGKGTGTRGCPGCRTYSVIEDLQIWKVCAKKKPSFFAKFSKMSAQAIPCHGSAEGGECSTKCLNFDPSDENQHICVCGHPKNRHSPCLFYFLGLFFDSYFVSSF